MDQLNDYYKQNMFNTTVNFWVLHNYNKGAFNLGVAFKGQVYTVFIDLKEPSSPTML